MHSSELLNEGDGSLIEPQTVASQGQTVSRQTELAQPTAYRLRAKLRAFTPQFQKAVHIDRYSRCEDLSLFLAAEAEYGLDNQGIEIVRPLGTLLLVMGFQKCYKLRTVLGGVQDANSKYRRNSRCLGW